MTTYSFNDVDSVDKTTIILKPRATKIMDSGWMKKWNTELHAALEDTPHLLLINMGSIEFLSSAAIHFLILLHKKVKAEGKIVVQCGLQEEIREIYKSIKLDTVLHCSDSREAAMKKWE